MRASLRGRTQWSRSYRIALTLLLAAARPSAAIELGGHIELASDYVQRGISQSDRRPALGLDLHLRHRDGWYAGITGHQIDFRERRPRLELGVYAGIAQSPTPEWAWQIGVVRYRYPGAPQAFGYDYHDLVVATSYRALDARVYYTPDYFAASGNSTYLDLSYHYLLTARLGLSLAGGVRRFFRRDAPARRIDGALGLYWDDGNRVLELTYVTTNLGRERCPLLRDWCTPAWVAKIGWRF